MESDSEGSESVSMPVGRLWRSIALCCVLACLAVYGYWGVWLPLHAAGYDFTGPYEAAYALVHHAPLQVYDVPAQRAYNDAVLHLPDGPSDFRWTPPAAVLLMPLALLPYWTARIIWWALSQAALLAALWLLARCVVATTGKGSGSRLSISSTPAVFLALFCAAAIAQPVTDSLRLGQSTTLLLLGFAMIAYGEVFDQQTVSGVGLAIAILDKLFPGVLLVFFLWRGRYRVCVVAVGFVALLALVTLPATGLGMYGAFARALRTYSNMPNAGPVNLSLYHGVIVGLSALLRPRQPEPVGGIFPVIAILLCAALFVGMLLAQGWPAALKGSAHRAKRMWAGEDSGGTNHRQRLFAVSWAVCSLLVVEPIDWIFYYLLLLVSLAWLLMRPDRAVVVHRSVFSARGWWIASMAAYLVATLPLPLDSRLALPMSAAFVAGICVRPAALLVLWLTHAAFAYSPGRKPVADRTTSTDAPTALNKTRL